MRIDVCVSVCSTDRLVDAGTKKYFRKDSKRILRITPDQIFRDKAIKQYLTLVGCKLRD